MHLLARLTTCPLCTRRSSTVHGACAACLRRWHETSDRYVDTSGPWTRVWTRPYDDLARRTLHALKFGGAGALAAPLGAVLYRALHANDVRVGAVTYVPLHRHRRWERGYDQARAIAAAVAHGYGVPLVTTLRRTRRTSRQARLGRHDRTENVSGAFLSLVVPRAPIVLIDDVVTTGATTDACARTLMAGGARSVVIATLARADPPGCAGARTTEARYERASEHRDESRHHAHQGSREHLRVGVS